MTIKDVARNEVARIMIRERAGRWTCNEVADAVAMAVLKHVRSEAHGAEDFIDGETVDALIDELTAVPERETETP